MVLEKFLKIFRIRLKGLKSKSLLRLFGIGLFILIVSKINFLALFNSLKRVNILYVIVVLVLNLPLEAMKALRWNSILKIQHIHISMINSILIYFSSVFVGIVSPSRVGEFVKAVYLEFEKGISVSKGMSSVLVDRLFDMYLLVTLGIIGIWQFDILGKLSNTSFVLIFIMVLAPLILLNKHLAGKAVGFLCNSFIVKKFEVRFEETFDDFYNGINQLISLKLIFPAFLTIFAYCIFFIQCHLLVIAMDLQISLVTIACFMSISNLISFLPVSIAGLGTRDATLIYLFSLIGNNPESAVSYSLLVFFVFYVYGALIGAVAWLIKPVSLERPRSSKADTTADTSTVSK